MPLAVEIHHGALDVRQCRGKVKYRSLEGAQEALIRVAGRFRDGTMRDPSPRRPMNVYVCGEGSDESCGFWHLGHRPAVLP